jgi:DNA repair exonuclease SbcCD ATPase subunit
VRTVVGKDYAEAVQDLADGEAYLMADFLEDDVQQVQVRRKRTFDAGATPDLEDFERPDLKSVSGNLVDELQEISEREERRQDRISQLEKQVEELQAEKAELEEELESARDMRDMATQFTEALQSGGNGDVTSEKVDELIAERNSLQSIVDEQEETIEELQARISELESELDQRPEISERAFEAVDVLAAEFQVGSGESETLRKKLKNARERIAELEASQNAPEPDALEHPSVQRYISRMQDELADLDEYEREMLQWFRFNGPGSVEDAYWAAGGSRKSSAKRKKLKTLRQKDLVAKVEQGAYDYALSETVAEWFAENDAVGDSEIEAICEQILSVLEEHDA